MKPVFNIFKTNLVLMVLMTDQRIIQNNFVTWYQRSFNKLYHKKWTPWSSFLDTPPKLAGTVLQSCKNLGSVVALQQGNFEKSHEIKANFEEKCAVLMQLQQLDNNFLSLNSITKLMSKSPKTLNHTHTFHGQTWQIRPYDLLLLSSYHCLVTWVKLGHKAVKVNEKKIACPNYLAIGP